MPTYKALSQNQFVLNEFKIIPIRDEDKFAILKWRNEQIYHLRQNKPLTKTEQTSYFSNTVQSLFKDKKPKQILFSYLENDICIGYGGLVHINWQDQHAEISFIMNTNLEKDNFEKHWHIFLNLIEKVAFEELKFKKIFLFIYNVRPHLYKIVKKVNYKLEATLKEHYFWNDNFIDAKIFTKFND